MYCVSSFYQSVKLCFNHLDELLHTSVFSGSQTFSSRLLQIKAIPTWLMNSSTKEWFCLFGLFMIKFLRRKTENALKNVMVEICCPSYEVSVVHMDAHYRCSDFFLSMKWKCQRTERGFFNHQESIYFHILKCKGHNRIWE